MFCAPCILRRGDCTDGRDFALHSTEPTVERIRVGRPMERFFLTRYRKVWLSIPRMQTRVFGITAFCGYRRLGTIARRHPSTCSQTWCARTQEESKSCGPTAFLVSKGAKGEQSTEMAVESLLVGWLDGVQGKLRSQAELDVSSWLAFIADFPLWWRSKGGSSPW